jgi:hypothetical protein
MNVDDTTPARGPWWKPLVRRFVGLPPHLAWLADEMPAAVPWIVRFQRLVLFVLPAGLLAMAAGDLLPFLGFATSDNTRLALAAVFLVGYLGSGVALSAVLATMGVVRLVRGSTERRRLAMLVLACAAIVGMAAYLVATIGVMWLRA